MDNLDSLRGRTIVITGASRGIGRAIALRCALDGANIVIAAKSDTPHAKLPSTIGEVADEVIAAGGNALAIKVDVREESQVQHMVERVMEVFGGIDALINNAGAIRLTGIEDTPLKRFDLMHAINERAVMLCTQATLPALKLSDNAHVVTLSPPINLEPHWLAPHIPYTVTKYGMTLMAMGLAGELYQHGIAVNAMWPRTVIATAAVEFEAGGTEMFSRCRKPEIVAEAIYRLLLTKNNRVTGQTLLDDQFLNACGVNDLSSYVHRAGTENFEYDLYVDKPTGERL